MEREEILKIQKKLREINPEYTMTEEEIEQSIIFARQNPFEYNPYLPPVVANSSIFLKEALEESIENEDDWIYENEKQYLLDKGFGFIVKEWEESFRKGKGR